VGTALQSRVFIQSLLKQMNEEAKQILLRILRRADRLATVAMHGDVPDYEMSEELSGVCGELIALIEDNCLSDDEPTPELLAVAQAVTRANPDKEAGLSK
jgi:hypothetical protein